MLSPDSYTNFPAAAQAVLSFLRQRFDFDHWMVSRIKGDKWIVLQSEGQDEAIEPGVVFSWPDSFCRQMVAGKGPRIAPDCQAVTAYSEAACNQNFKIGAYIGIPLSQADGSLFGTLCAIDPQTKSAAITQELPMLELLAQLLSSVLHTELALEREIRSRERSQLEAVTDALTGLYNRRGWDEVLELEEQRCQDYGHPATVIALDLDDLKLVNDTLGHLAGDELLKMTAQILAQQSRSGDCVARWGGDEFWMLLVDCDGEAAAAIADRLAAKLDTVGIRASLGWASRHPTFGLTRAIEAADRVMYAQKRQRKQNARPLTGVTCFLSGSQR
jgi:diguanylate cyclase